MKLLVPLAIALAHAAEEVVDTADAGWKTSSDADTREWRNDVMHASNTMKQIKNKACKPPARTNLGRLGSPKQVCFECVVSLNHFASNTLFPLTNFLFVCNTDLRFLRADKKSVADKQFMTDNNIQCILGSKAFLQT